MGTVGPYGRGQKYWTVRLKTVLSELKKFIGLHTFFAKTKELE
jgi:hypothetical protein